MDIKKGISLLVITTGFSKAFAQVDEGIQKASAIITPYIETYPGISVAKGRVDEIIWSEGLSNEVVKIQVMSMDSIHEWRNHI